MTIFVERLAIGETGLRLAVKDTIDVAGVPTRCGSPAFADAMPAERHAHVVARLLEAGCRIVGKTTLHELAFGVTGLNTWAGTPLNPLDASRIPGGSSSGSAAAVAAGEADIALGTDTGGSVRIPAACCGTIGLKPSFGRISRLGVYPKETSLDCVGLFGRSMDDIIFAMAAIDDVFAVPSPASVKVGLLDIYADPAITRALSEVLDASDLEVVTLVPPSLATAFDAGLTIIGHEHFTAFGSLLETGLLGEDVALRLKAASATTRSDVEAAEVVRSRFRVDVDDLLDRCDALVLPTMPGFPPTLDAVMHDHSAVNLSAYVRPFNLSGHPALSLPVPTSANFPAGMQLVAAHGEDELLCAIARRLESVIAKTPTSGELVID